MHRARERQVDQTVVNFPPKLFFWGKSKIWKPAVTDSLGQLKPDHQMHCERDKTGVNFLPKLFLGKIKISKDSVWKPAMTHRLRQITKCTEGGRGRDQTGVSFPPTRHFLLSCQMWNDSHRLIQGFISQVPQPTCHMSVGAPD